MATRFVAPFEIQPIPKYVREELERRERDVGVNFISNTFASWDDDGNWNTYKGPMRCWVRVCSNGIGEERYGSKEGFVMSGATGFYKDVGIRKLWLSRKPLGEFCLFGVFVCVHQVARAGGVLCSSHELAADGVLVAALAFTRCSSSWGGGAHSRHQCFVC